MVFLSTQDNTLLCKHTVASYIQSLHKQLRFGKMSILNLGYLTFMAVLVNTKNDILGTSTAHCKAAMEGFIPAILGTTQVTQSQFDVEMLRYLDSDRIVTELDN